MAEATFKIIKTEFVRQMRYDLVLTIHFHPLDCTGCRAPIKDPLPLEEDLINMFNNLYFPTASPLVNHIKNNSYNYLDLDRNEYFVHPEEHHF